MKKTFLARPRPRHIFHGTKEIHTKAKSTDNNNIKTSSAKPISAPTPSLLAPQQPRARLRDGDDVATRGRKMRKGAVIESTGSSYSCAAIDASRIFVVAAPLALCAPSEGDHHVGARLPVLDPSVARR
jgi:hypothetical protein